MSTSADLRFEQAIYGSRSGDRDFRILARSSGVARADRDLIEQHANLGGSALTAATVEPIYSAFPLDPRGGRHGFARAVVLGRGGRGNDYLVHVLILSPALLQALRGDLFLLEEAGLFGDRKPEGEELPALDLGPDRWEVASRRVLGADRPADLPLENLAPLLAALAEGPLAVQVAEGGFALAICRALLSTLPPDDRPSLSFCSRFCQPRPLSYRFAAFVPEDRPLADRYLRGAVRTLPAADEGPIAEWLAAAREGIEPMSGLSLLADPEGTVARMRLLRSLRQEGGPAPAARFERADLARADARVVEIARHPANAALPRFSPLVAGLLAHGLKQSAEAALAAGDPAGLLADCETSLARASAADLVAELSASGGVAGRTAWIAVAVVAGPADLLGEALDPAGGGVASWIEDLLVSHPGFSLSFLALAFTHLRETEGNAALPKIMAMLAGLPADVPLQPALAAIEKAAPEESEGRRTWFHTYLKLLLPVLGTRVPAALAARLAGQEGLLESMGEEDLIRLAPELAASFPQLLDRERLAALPDRVLETLLATVADGLGSGGASGVAGGWDLARFPERGRLAERVATRVGERLSGSSPHLSRGALALLRAAALRAEVAAAPLRSLLLALLRAHPPGLTASAARTAARWRRRLGPFPAFDPRELAAIRAQACRDARESAPRGAGWPVLVWLETLSTGASRV